MTLGRVQERKSEEEIELVYYKRLLRKSPEKHVLLDFLADTYFKMANYEEAIHCWKKLLQRINKKGRSRIHAKIALTYEYLGEPEFSYHYYKLALKENPKDEYIIGKYGELAYIIENYKDALYAFKKVCELEPDNDVAWHNLALTYYSLGYHDEAVASLEVALGLNERSAETWYTLATIYAENYLLVDALIALEKALIIDKDLQKKALNEESFFTLRDSEIFNYMIYGQ